MISSRFNHHDVRAGTPGESFAAEPSRAVYQATLSAMAAIVETRDPAAGDHLGRIRAYCRVITRHLDRQPRCGRPLSNREAETLVEASTLHDIGKATIPDAILLKPGPLNRSEFACMKRHTLAGFRTLTNAMRQVGRHPFLVTARQIACFHHERWDGGGYPTGISGERIPLAARIVAVADVFDALVSRRCYKAPIPVCEARGIIRRGAGRHFDSVVVDAFERGADEIEAVAGGMA